MEPPAANQPKPRATSARMAPPSFIEEIERPGPPPSMEEGPKSSRALTVFVAVFALLAFGGVVWYAYDQGRRIGGEAAAPLIKADPAPTKIRPEEPGGLTVPNRDKLVFDRLPGAGRDTARVERLLPPPETPVPPPVPATPPAPVVEATRPPPVSVAGVVAADIGGGSTESGSGTVETPTVAVPPPPPPVVASRPAAIPPARIETPPPPPPNPQATDQTVSPKAPVATAAPAPAAPAPPSAPVTVQPQAPAATATVVAPVPAPAPPPPAVGGPFNIQIAALRDRTSAEAEWARVVRRFPAELEGLSLTIKEVDLGDRGIFHRVQGGSLPEARARALCATLSAGGQACLVVRR